MDNLDIENIGLLNALSDINNDDVFNKYHNLTYLKSLVSSPDLIRCKILDQQGQNVVNLSSLNIDQHTVDTLSLGLTYCPTPTEASNGEALLGTEQFFRKLRIAHFFHGKQNNQNKFDYARKLQIKSDWSPPTTDPTIETFCKTVRKEALKQINCRKRKNTPKNITPGQLTCLNTLKSNRDLVIKKADKGNAIVLMNTVDYLYEVESQLADTNFYMRCQTDLTEYHSLQVNMVVHTLFNHNAINTRIKKHLLANDCKAGRFYILPKIHKYKLVGRPIVSATNSPTEKLSHFCDIILNKYTPLNHSFVRDTTDFINKISAIHTSDGDLIVTADVTSLYTRIPTELGLTCMAKKLQMLNKHFNLPVTSQDILSMLKTILTCNNFEFNGNHYLQIQGVSMGTRVAPTYANMVLSVMEDSFLEEQVLKPKCWFRFIDDICFIWGHGEKELLSFIQAFNNIHKSIQLTFEFSYQSVNFLDTTVKLTPPSVSFDLFKKPTDTTNYLMHKSCHPPGCKKGFFSQLLRLRRNCTDLHKFVHHANALKDAFITRGYTRKSLDTAITQATSITRDSLLTTKVHVNQEKRFICVLPHNPLNVNLGRLVHKYWPILQSSISTMELFKTKPVIGFRRPKNLRETLVKAQVQYPPNLSATTGCPLAFQSDTCDILNCRKCHRFNTRKHFTSSTTKSRYRKSDQQIDCESRNLIYLITCKYCKHQYVGETKQTLHMRIYQHAYSVRKQLNTPVARHFNNPTCKWDEASVECIEALKGDPDDNHFVAEKRLNRELYWIVELSTLSPYGINVKLGRSISS